MKSVSQFLAGSLLGVALFSASLAMMPDTAWAQQPDVRLVCTGGMCCGYDGTTGEIYWCDPIQ